MDKVTPREFRPRVWPHVLLIAFNAMLALAFGAALYYLGQGLLNEQEAGATLAIISGIAVLMALLLWMSIAAVLRRVLLLQRKPGLKLSREGIHARWAVHGFYTLFRPSFRWSEQRIAWKDFKGCRVDRVLLNHAIPIKESVVIESASAAPAVFTWGMLQPGPVRMQREILDYHDFVVSKPARESARVPEFLEMLFKEPRIISSPRLGRAEVVLTSLCVPLLIAYLCFHFWNDMSHWNALALSIGLTTAGVVAGIFMVRHWIMATRFIQLSSKGISLGRDAQSARIIPWNDLAFARVHQIAGNPPSSLTKLELRLHGGSAVFIRAFPEAAHLAALIDPPADLVQRAWELIDQGLDADTAAKTAGLTD